MGDIEEFVIGDLVQFTGYMSAPDIVYAEQFDDRVQYGIVIANTSGHYSNSVYKVYWFSERRIVETVAAHMRLVYVTEKDAP